ncbi:hypothetical protein [Pseudoalteromonas sp.]|uniref:hypothetical protein n=1 Tax=Pseudoalteromonas sp. TaxID=53249 RepID=UPI002635031D|nr:hypothetical protein [Pseudoalteromonas sp.]MCP4589071.1 hypothetical protein [Pseudoalteromonas sp.]
MPVENSSPQQEMNIVNELQRHAVNIKKRAYTVKDVANLADELSLYSDYLVEQFGSHQSKSKMALSMSTLSRLAQSEQTASDIDSWLDKYPIYRELTRRIDHLCEEIKELLRVESSKMS